MNGLQAAAELNHIAAEYDRLKAKYEKLKKAIVTVQTDFSIDGVHQAQHGFEVVSANMKTGATMLGRLLLQNGYITLTKFPLSEDEYHDMHQYRMTLTVLKPDATGESFADQLEARGVEGRASGIKAAADYLIDKKNYWGAERDSRYWGELVRDLK